MAFVITLSDADWIQLAMGQSVHAQPWRHLFGNVTKGPGGDFPFGQGFQALARFCGQSAEGGSGLDLTDCGSRLYAWADTSADGFIDPGEVRGLPELGIEALNNVRSTGKKDSCGNTFPVETHATCTGQSGKCGTWLDVFFQFR